MAENRLGHRQGVGTDVCRGPCQVGRVPVDHRHRVGVGTHTHVGGEAQERVRGGSLGHVGHRSQCEARGTGSVRHVETDAEAVAVGDSHHCGDGGGVAHDDVGEGDAVGGERSRRMGVHIAGDGHRAGGEIRHGSGQIGGIAEHHAQIVAVGSGPLPRGQGDSDIGRASLRQAAHSRQREVPVGGTDCLQADIVVSRRVGDHKVRRDRAAVTDDHVRQSDLIGRDRAGGVAVNRTGHQDVRRAKVGAGTAQA